jgi:hypothetical protein
MRRELETKHFGKWLLIHDRKLIGACNSFEDAAKEVVDRYGRGPYLIRQAGAPAATLPAAVSHHPIDEDD